MLLYSLSALAFSPVATAHASNVAEWPMSGSNDTGWVLIESTGADPSTQTMATGDMFHNFAPGAEISNLTFEIQVNGSDGVWVTEPQLTIMEPSTVYGISKQVGERWCEYYYNKYDIDVRSIRYPGLISYTSLPGGGTTDYAVDMFYQAKLGNHFTCFLKDDTVLPMMYMDDAIRATLEIMNAPKENIKIRSSYNLSALSFTPKEIFEEIQKHIPDFKINYMPDFRQKIADTWPSSIDDTFARSNWGWKETYNLEMLVKKMLDNVDVSILSNVS